MRRVIQLIGRIGLFWLVWALAAAPAQTTETVLHNFASPPNGALPYSGVSRDAAGNLYGTAYDGGVYGLGTVYKINSSGQQVVLHSFAGTDGALPQAGVIRDAAGNLYGTTYAGGSMNLGTVYKVAANGQETVLYNFTGAAEGAFPYAGVIRDAAGNLYGTTETAVYKLDPSGHLTVLYDFLSTNNGGVISDSAGNLYGTTFGGGAYGFGSVYRIEGNGNGTTLFSFPGGAGGSNPRSSLTIDTQGNLYGVATGGPAGIVFKIDPSGNETVLYSFTGGLDGDGPDGQLLRDGSGNLYGTTIYGGPANAGVVYKLAPNGKETVLYGFNGGADGTGPTAGVITDSAGGYYGTTPAGGASNIGTVFKVKSIGNKTTIYNFPGTTDGSSPDSVLLQDRLGNLYGTTAYGGAQNYGIVFKLDQQGHETILHSFTGGTDGANPMAGLIRDSAGNFYGTTFWGGASNAGTVYRMTASGEETLLYSFTGGTDGSNPNGGVIMDNFGNLCGVTKYGGNGLGVVYKIDKTGHETVVHSFNSVDGAFPSGRLVRDPAGDLYGTTEYGGTQGFNGVVFKVAAQGGETVLHNFGGSDGAYPLAGVVLDSSGNLYGTTYQGGQHQAGTVFKVDQTGKETVLYNFTGGADGGFPNAGLARDASGNLYGTAGVVFKLDSGGNETVLHTFTNGSDGGSPAGVILDSKGNLYGAASTGGLRAAGLVYVLSGN